MIAGQIFLTPSIFLIFSEITLVSSLPSFVHISVIIMWSPVDVATTDFTPVCTTEFVAFAKINDELVKRNVKLIGLSIDSVFSHIAWIRKIKEKFGIDIPFPVIADLDMKVANLFGMIHPGESTTAAVRCVFVIDPEMKLRAMIYYPLNVGRNMQEILRLIDALQTADKYKVATPANWKPGDDVIVPPPTTQEVAEKRLQEGYECIDWFLCKKKLSPT